MSDPWQLLAWTGQALFFSRFLIQWWASEKAGKSVAPAAFWWCSVGGTLLVGSYAWIDGEAILLPVFCINSAVYLRNLLLYTERGRALKLHPLAAAGAGLLACAVFAWSGAFEPREGLGQSLPWLVVGGIGTALWSSRFLLQWWSSERHGRSTFPESFWWISLAGNALLLAYMIHLGKLVYIVGFAVGPFVQIRNLVLIHRRRREALVPRPAADQRVSPDSPSDCSTKAATAPSRNVSTP